jgi:hypothetical protein
VPIPKEEGERYEAMNAVPAKAASVGVGAAQPAKISKPEFSWESGRRSMLKTVEGGTPIEQQYASRSGHGS